MLDSLFENIFTSPIESQISYELIGHSREERPIKAYRFGTGNFPISLIAGCHADEPVGPTFLRKLTSYLSTLSPDSELLSKFQWWIIPHINPDGEVRNAEWFSSSEEQIDIVKYLKFVHREAPGDDIEFGFPRTDEDTDARPENMAAYQWWKQAKAPFLLHASLHSMAVAGGAWFLVDENWATRIDLLKRKCKEVVSELGYDFHDVERYGEKGFCRIEKGFCTRPNSKAMSKFFTDRGDDRTASLFRPSSMETIRSFGADTLTLVSEMPAFVLKGVGVDIGPPDLVAEKWKTRIERWKVALSSSSGYETAVSDIQSAVEALEIIHMPIEHQMRLQWVFVCAGIEQVFFN